MTNLQDRRQNLLYSTLIQVKVLWRNNAIIVAGFLPQWEAVMAVSDDKGPVGSSKQHAEASVGRIGDDVQRAKENISDAAAKWAVEIVEARLVEAAAVIRRLPPVRVPGYFNTWPAMVVEFADRVGQEPQPMRLPPPPPSAISRMEEALGWLPWFEPNDAKIVWRRVSGERWKSICWKVGLERAAANEHFQYALCVIAWHLNGRRKSKSASRRLFISATRGATSVA